MAVILTPRRGPLLLAVAAFCALVLLGGLARHRVRWPGQPLLGADVFAWNSTAPPAWLARPAAAPLRLRVAVVTHPAEFARRAALRELVFAGVPPAEVALEYRFFLGLHQEDGVNEKVAAEALRHDDVFMLSMLDSRETLGAKRWEALLWGADAPPRSFDWFFTIDTDAFVRFAALARRAASWHADLARPHDKSVLWGHMLTMNRHWRDSHTVPAVARKPHLADGDDGRWTSGDESWRAEWYDYPAGFGYLMSAHLVSRLTAPNVTLAHSVRYPFDDMVIGSWINENAPETVVLHDWDGFHDPPHHGWKTGVIGWDTVVVHHLNPAEMREMRALPQFEGEWV